MGITETEATTPGVSTTNRFGRWIYRVDIGPIGSPKLKADTTDNAIGQPIEITFTDNSAWREKITQVKVDETVLNSQQYAITAGKLTINSDVFTKAGDYTITVESSGFMKSTVKQTINGPPAYTVTFTVTDGTSAIQGANITIAEQTLTTDADGKATIDLEDGAYTYGVTAIGFITITDGSVTVSGAALAEAVTMTVNPAGLTDAEKVAVAKANLTLGDISAVTADLTLPGTQNEATVTWTSGNTNVITNDGKVTRPAAGQPDANATLTATITAGETSDTKTFTVTVLAEETTGPKAPPALTADNTDNKVGQAIEITFTDDETWRGAISEVKVGDTVLESSQYNKAEGKIIIATEAFTEAKDYTIVIKANGYNDATVTQSIISEQSMVAGNIYTIAGIGLSGYSGDSNAAINAQLTCPYGLVFDKKGNLYIADSNNHRIRKVDTSGTITTVAGNGTRGYGGDGGLAVNAQLNKPFGITMDNNNNLYIADKNNNCIRKVDTSGTITTVAGTGTNGYAGDGGAANSAQLDFPYGVAIDSTGNLYIADNNNHRIRKVNTSGIINTVAGTGSGGYSGDGGTAVTAQLCNPCNVILDNIGNLYISDYGNHRIRKVDTSGIINTIVGIGSSADPNIGSGDDGPATSALLANPSGIAMDSSGNLYIAEFMNNCIRKVDASGIITTIAGNRTKGYSGDDGPATNAQLNYPAGIALDSTGSLYIADYNNHRIRFVKAFTAPPSLTVDSSDNKVGNPIGFTFTDDQAWRDAITEVKVGNTVLNSSQYTKAEGKITIAAGVFTEAGTYTIVIKATGYEDASVTQIINKDYVTTTLSIKINNGNPITVTAEQINALNPNHEIRHFSHYKDGQMNYWAGQGAPLAAVLSQYASLNSTNIASVTVRGADGYYVTFADPQNELFNQRYYYPAVGEKVQVDTIIATKAAENLASEINQLDNTHSMRLMMGQTSSEERTVSRMVKWVSEIDITTTAAINVPVTGVILNKTAATLVVNHSEQLTVSVTPANATDQTVTWTSDNEAVATVDNTGKVTAVGTGQAVITATTKDGSFSASCTVTVATKPLYKLTPVEDDVYTIGTSDGSSTMTVNAGKSGFKTFTVSVEPAISHKGNETVIFTHWRGGTELQLNATVADFDVANTAQAGFNVQPGDVIKVYIVDRLTNDSNINPVVFQ